MRISKTNIRRALVGSATLVLMAAEAAQAHKFRPGPGWSMGLRVGVHLAHNPYKNSNLPGWRTDKADANSQSAWIDAGQISYSFGMRRFYGKLEYRSNPLGENKPFADTSRSDGRMSITSARYNFVGNSRFWVAQYRYFATAPNNADPNSNDLGNRLGAGQVAQAAPQPPAPPQPPPPHGLYGLRDYLPRPPTGQVPETFILYSVYDRAEVTPDAAQVLERAIQDFHTNGHTHIVIMGHADNHSRDHAYNQGLSERRAAAVRNFLIERGVPPGQIQTATFSESYPRVPTPDSAEIFLHR